MNEYELSVQALNKFSNMFPDDTEVFLEMGDVLREKADFVRAIKYYDFYLDIKKDSKEDKINVQHAYSQKAECLWELGKNGKALEILNFLLNYQKENFGENSKYMAKTCSDLAHVLGKQGNNDKAL